MSCSLSSSLHLFSLTLTPLHRCPLQSQPIAISSSASLVSSFGCCKTTISLEKSQWSSAHFQNFRRWISEMEALGGGLGGLWRLNASFRKRLVTGSKSKSSDSVEATGGAGYRFPLKQAVTAGSFALAGDTIAQLRERWRKVKVLNQHSLSDSHGFTKDVMWTLLSDHDLLRSLRMISYGFLFYGPGSYAWYQYLDRCMPKQTVENIMLKVLLNQIVLGPSVIAVVFAWNNLWQGKLSQLPEKYKKDALTTLLYGFRFWIPVSALNFWAVPLQARVAFMSMGSIFWNFCLSSTMSK